MSFVSSHFSSFLCYCYKARNSGTHFLFILVVSCEELEKVLYALVFFAITKLPFPGVNNEQKDGYNIFKDFFAFELHFDTLCRIHVCLLGLV